METPTCLARRSLLRMCPACLAPWRLPNNRRNASPMRIGRGARPFFFWIKPAGYPATTGPPAGELQP
eukprot:11210940-Lingulodinium_polyedra.AAC.1